MWLHYGFILVAYILDRIIPLEYFTMQHACGEGPHSPNR
jgi:hypothetical protein